MPNLRKPFYHIDEVLERWSMSERDIMSFVLAGSLTVSATVAGLRVTCGICRPSAAGVTDRIASSHRYVIGIVHCRAVTRGASCDRASFPSPRCRPRRTSSP